MAITKHIDKDVENQRPPTLIANGECKLVGPLQETIGKLPQSHSHTIGAKRHSHPRCFLGKYSPVSAQMLTPVSATAVFTPASDWTEL